MNDILKTRICIPTERRRAMKKLLVILCLCSLLLAFAGCSGTAPVSTKDLLPETTTDDTSFERTETAVLPPVREYVRTAVKEECTFEAYTITAKDVCSFGLGTDEDHALIVCPVVSIPAHEKLAEQINAELYAWMTEGKDPDSLSHPEGVTLIDCMYSITYADETKFSIMCYKDSFVFNGIAGVIERKGITADVKNGKICTLSDVYNVKELPKTAKFIGIEASYLFTEDGILNFFTDESSTAYTDFSMTEDGLLLVLPAELYARSTGNAIVELQFEDAA